MPIDFNKPVTGDNYATGVLPALRGGRVALAQWLDPAVAGTLENAPTGAWRVKSASNGAVERFNGTSWEASPINGVHLSGGSVVIGATSPGAIGAGTDTFAVAGNIGFSTQLNGRPAAGAAIDIVNRASGGHIDLYPASSRSVRFAAGGNVLIGTTVDSGHRLRVEGSASVTGSINTPYTGTDNVVHGVTPSPTDAFTVESSVRLSHYGLTWANLPSQTAGATAVLSAYGGLKVFVQGALAFHVAAGGNASSIGAFSAARVVAGYDAGLGGSMSCNNWFRSAGATGWINATYGGGIHMSDSTWLRTYGGKSFYCDQNILAAGDITISSDERLKINWRALAADYVEQLARVKHGVYYRKDLKAWQAGISAQSFHPVLPEAVGEGPDGMLNVSYANAALVSCVAIADYVTERLAALNERVRALEAA